MRFLDRSTVQVPASLSKYPTGSAWEELTRNHADYDEVVDSLNTLQKTRCAYCECDLSREGTRPHVEHFEQRSRAPNKTFDWSNLFRSCTHHDCCGKHKDALVGKYADCDILKPDVDQPRQYLEFDADGGVAPRRGLDERQRHRAEETIRVFQLNARHLVGARTAYLRGPRSEFENAVRAMADDPAASDWVNDIAERYKSSAFSAAILDLLGAEP